MCGIVGYIKTQKNERISWSIKPNQNDWVSLGGLNSKWGIIEIEEYEESK